MAFGQGASLFLLGFSKVNDMGLYSCKIFKKMKHEYHEWVEYCEFLSVYGCPLDYSPIRAIRVKVFGDASLNNYRFYPQNLHIDVK